MEEDGLSDTGGIHNITNETTRELLGSKENRNTSVDPKWKDVSNQILASCITALTVIHVGLHMSFSAVLLPQLEDDKDNYRITKSEASWIASCLVLSTPFGSLISGPLSDKFGRKKANMMSCIPTIASWIIIAGSPAGSVEWLYLARILGGFGGGMTTTFIVYTSEICNEKFRAMMLSLNSVAVALGILVITVNAIFMSWRTMAMCYSTLAIITYCLIWGFTPESPHWLFLISKKSNRRILTEKALRWLNPNEEIYNKTFNQILGTSRQSDEINKTGETTFKSKVKQSLLYLMSPNICWPLTLLMGLMMLQQLSGGYAIIFYTIHIFKKFGRGIDEYHALVILGVIRFFSSAAASVLARVIRRKTLLYVSSICMATCYVIISIYQYYLQLNHTPFDTSQLNNKTGLHLNSSITFNEPNETNYTIVSSNWLPVVCILAIVGMGAIGLLNIPWTLISEILPTSIRGRGSGFIISFAYVVLFVVVKIYPFLLDLLDIGYLFLMQGIVCIATVIYVLVFVPETLGKSLHEIELHFAKENH